MTVDLVESLIATTFCGRRFSREKINEIIGTVKTFPNLSRKELAHTICEHTNWVTPMGGLKINSALALLKKFESLGLCSPPTIRVHSRRPKIQSAESPASEKNSHIRESLEDISPISLRLVEDNESDSKRFNEAMKKHHYLSYKKAYGAYLRYFIVDKNGRELGLLLFASPAWALADRDHWIGWKNRHRIKRLHLVISNSRFLIFPWVQVQNLASKALSLVPPRIADDWFVRYGYRPVLMETFVDQEKYLGTCYQASNWTKLGQTKGVGRYTKDSAQKTSIKDIYAYPLVENFRDVLLRGEQSTNRKLTTNEDIRDRLCRIHDDILGFWSTIAPLIRSLAEGFDATWQKRGRVTDTMLLVLIIFRLVATRAKKGYGSTIDEVWETCRNQGLPLPQKNPIAPSTFCDARQKLDEDIFKIINGRVIEEYQSVFENDAHRFNGHRIYAVDGSKINLPHELIKEGFATSNDKTHYPQGLLSCLYRLKVNIPCDFILTNDTNERRVSLTHHQVLDHDDIVVYDRGYFSYEILHAHVDQGLHAVFRLCAHTYTEIMDFIAGDTLDSIVSIKPKSEAAINKLRKINPSIEIKDIQLRLVKYCVDSKTYFIGTTLLEQKYSIPELQDLYHSRWGIEELYKTTKHTMGTEEFHSKSLRGVRQEVYAQLALVTLNRLFTNHTDDNHKINGKNSKAKTKTNFKNSILAFARNAECLIIGTGHALQIGFFNLLSTIGHLYQKQRPNRSYPRVSLTPKSKWNSAEYRTAARAAKAA